MSSIARTYLAFQHNAKLYSLKTTVTSIRPFPAVEEANRLLFPKGTNEDHVVVTEQTIFHPQGGGQPSDIGTMSIADTLFTVASVRMDGLHDGQVLHFGRFSSAVTALEGSTIEQNIDVEKRLLHSRLHTAGHILGAAVRHLLENEILNFDELKASHFPDSAACEFQGLIEGKWKAPIQEKVDAFVKKDMEVVIEWWDEEDFVKRGLGRLIPERRKGAEGEKYRVVDIKGAEVYPCGGTHVDSTALCEGTKVKKISRSKGTSRVSYSIS